LDNRRTRFILILIVLLGIISNLVWISIDKITEREEAINLIRSVNYRNILHSDISLKDKIRLITARDRTKPHYSSLYYLFPAIFPINIDLYADFAKALNVVYLVSILFFIYKIADHIFKDKRIALLSSYVTLCSPIIFSLSRWFIPTIAVISFVVLCAYLLFRSEGFKDRTFSILFVIFFLIGSLLANYFLCYFILPLLLVSLRRLVDISRNFKKIKLQDICICILILFSMWLFSKNYSFYIYNAVIKKVVYFRLLEYLSLVLINKQIYLINFVFLVIGIISAVFFKRNIKKLMIFIAGILPISLIISIACLNPSIRVTAPFVPFYAILISFWIFKVKNNLARKALVAFIIMSGFFIFIKASFGFLDREIGDRFYIRDKKTTSDFCLFDHVTWTETHPINQDWHCKEIADALLREYKNEKGRILIIPDIDELNANIISYYMASNNNSLDLLYFWDYTMDFYTILFNSRYIFLKSGKLIGNVGHSEMFNVQQMEVFINKKPERFLSNFILIDSYNLPDGSVGRLYKRKGALLLDRHIEERIKILEEAVRFNPESIIARVLLFRDLKEMGNTKRSERELNIANRLLQRLHNLSKREKRRLCYYQNYLYRLVYDYSGNKNQGDWLDDQEEIRDILLYGK